MSTVQQAQVTRLDEKMKQQRGNTERMLDQIDVHLKECNAVRERNIIALTRIESRLDKLEFKFNLVLGIIAPIGLLALNEVIQRFFGGL